MKYLTTNNKPDFPSPPSPPLRPAWLVAVVLTASLFASVNSRAASESSAGGASPVRMSTFATTEIYIEGADLDATTSLDMWHHSGGYWKVGNAGSDKIVIDDTEIEKRGYASILASSRAEFQIPLPGTIRQKISEGRQIACRVEGRSAALHELFDPGSVEFDFTATTLYFRAKPIFNLIAQNDLSFTDYNLSPAREIPLIDRAFGYNIYSLFGNGESGAQAAGRVSIAQPHTIENGYVHPSMITSLAGHLMPGHIIHIRGNPVDSAGYRVGDGTFAAGGAVGLSFSFPVRFKFYEIVEGEVPGDPEDPPAPEDVTVTAQLDLPPSTYEGHSVYATDASLFYTEEETVSATRAYAEGLATNRFSIVESGAGSITRRSSVRAEAVFPTAGRYQVRLNVDTQSGHAGQDTKPIDVLKTPAIEHSLTGTQKQNRKQVLNFRIAKRPAETLVDVWVKLEYLDEGEWVTLHHASTGGNALQNSDSIKTRPIERLPASDEYFEYGRLEFLLKNTEPANCRYTIYAEDSRGEWDRVTADFTVSPDRPPEANILLDAEFVRGEGSNVAEIEVEDVSTTDGDQIDRSWFYRSLAVAESGIPPTGGSSGGAPHPLLVESPPEGHIALTDWIRIDGNFPGYEDRSFGTGKTIAFSKAGVGLFEVGLIAKDRWTEETLEEYVTEEDRLQNSTVEISDVVNIAPVVDIEPVRLQTASVTILTGGHQAYDAAQENRSRLESELLARGIDANISVTQMIHEASETISPGAVRTASVQTPFGYQGNWLFYESDNYIADEAHLYKLDGTWVSDVLDGYPGPPHTISCWAFNAAGTQDVKWTFTFGDDILPIPRVRSGPYFAQDDQGRYLFLVAGGKTLILTKDTGQMLAVLDAEVGHHCFSEGNRIYTFLPGGIARISATMGQFETMYTLPVMQGMQRKLWGRVHFVTGAGTDMRRGLFDPATEQLSFEALCFEDPVYGIANHEVLVIDVDGRIVVETRTRGRIEAGGSAGEINGYFARTHVYGRDNRLSLATPAKQDSTYYPYTVAPVLDEGGACTHIAHTWNSRSSSARYGYAQVYRLSDGATLTGEVKGGKDDYPTASSKILFAREIAGQVYVTNGAEWVYVWNTGYNIYQERVKTFVFNPGAGTVRTGNLYGELGISLTTFESGVVSEAIAVVQAGYNTPGNAYSLNDVLRWDQTLPMILKRYATRNYRGESDINMLVVCDELNPSSLYESGADGEIAALVGSYSGRFAHVTRRDIEEDGLLNLIVQPEAEGRGTLVATVPEGEGARVSKSYRLTPGCTYYVEYDVALDDVADVEEDDLLRIHHELTNTPGATFGPLAYRTVASYAEDFENADHVNPFFRYEAKTYSTATGTVEVVSEGYYKGAYLILNRSSSSSNAFGSHPYPADLTALKFTVPEGKKAFLAFNYLMQKNAEYYGASAWCQSYVKIDGKLWAEYNVHGGRGHYSHPGLLEAGEHTLTFFASNYGKKEQAKMWLEDIRVDLVESMGVPGASGMESDGLWTPDLQAGLQDVSVRPLGDGYARVSGTFSSLPQIPVYREVENSIVIDGPIHTVPHVTVTNSTSENYAFQLDVPPGKTAIFTRIPTTSTSASRRNVRYSVPMFIYRSDGKNVWATDTWTVLYKVDNAQQGMYNWPRDGVITAGPLQEPRVFTLAARAYDGAYGSMDGVTSIMVDNANAHWLDKSFFLQKMGGETKYMLESGPYKGAKLSFQLPEGIHKIRDLKVYFIEDGLRRYAADESFANPASLSTWSVSGGSIACVRSPAEAPPEQESLVYKKGELVSYNVHYFDYESDPSKRSFWRYTHTPFNDGAHPDAALILDEYGEPVAAPGTVLSAPIERFYIDGKYTVEHWQEDNTARPPTEGGNPAYDKLSNVVSLTFYVEGGGQAPWIKSIKTIPGKVKEGESYLIEVEVDDAEGDVLSLTTELYRGRQRIYVHREEGIEPVSGGVTGYLSGAANPHVATSAPYILSGGALPTAGRYAPVRTGTAPVAVAGSYEIVCTVRDATGAGLGSYRFDVQSEGGIEGAVDHTDAWDANRRGFNVKHFGEEFNATVSFSDYLAMPMPRKRGYNVFWPGERLCLRAQAQGAPVSVRAYPRGRPELTCDLAVAGPAHPSGHTRYEAIVDSTHKWAPGSHVQPSELIIRFVATYPGGIEKISDVPVILCGSESYWQLHRLY
ncbi:MAG: hypothetical protein ACOX4E_05465 [Anaerovoracaceae bacterium]